MSTIITKAEVKKNRNRNKLWMIIHDDVYDVTKFVEEHPGGEDTLLDAAGTDATEAFEDVGHSEDARELLKQYKIGTLPDDEKAKQPAPVCCLAVNRPPVKKTGKNWRNFDAPDGGSPLTGKGSKSARFAFPPDKCDEPATANAAPSKVFVDNENSITPKVKKKTKKGCEKRRERGLPCDQCGGSNWKWWALAAFIIGAIAVGAIVVKKNS